MPSSGVSTGAVLNTYLPRPRNKTGVNLLSTEGEQRAAREQHALEAGRPREVISMLKPNVSIALVDDFTVYPADKIPDPVRRPQTCHESAQLSGSQCVLFMCFCICCEVTCMYH